MSKDSPKILIISSCRLSQGPASIAKQYYDAFCQYGYETDLLLKYPEPDFPEIKYVVEEDYWKSFWFRVRNKYIKFKSRNWKIFNNQYCFFYTKEKYPPIPSKIVISKIEKRYDLVLIVFWQGLLSFETIQKIYNKLHCQIHFTGVDYSQMSGGCHFTGSCNHYITGCGKCPALLSEDKNDFTAWNVRYRKKVYDKVKPIVYGNQYMLQFYQRSFLLKDANCELLPSAIIDTDVFCPLAPSKLKEKYGIPLSKKYILLFGCQDLGNPKKGITYLLESLSLLKQQMKDEEDSILIVMVGNGYEKIRDRIPFESIGFGYVDLNKLPEIYAISNCFICSSVDDAGPMMVNQSLCCGIPVVGFEMGAVLQVVKNRGTGVSVPLKDSKKLADGIYRILKMSEEEYTNMKRRCRDVALKTCSYKAIVDLFITAYKKYLDSDNKG